MQLNAPSLFVEQAYINGEWLAADKGATLRVNNPATGDLLGSIPDMGSAETCRAIKAAQQALVSWRARSASDRGRILRRWYELILANQEDLALLMTLEQGKPLAESRGEIALAAAVIEWCSEEAKRAYGETIPGRQPDKRILVTKEPVGVCAAVTSWSFPAAMVARKAGPALAAGCTLVLKPASQTPYSAIALCRLAERAGLPNGVLNLVTGSAWAIGRELTSNPRVRKLTFSGSIEVGKRLMADCADTVKQLSLELGGNAPFIVFDDADLDAAVAGALESTFRNAGQGCIGANRLLVHDSVYDLFAEKLVAAVNAMQVGNGLEPGVTQGPLIDVSAVEQLQDQIEDAVFKGATILTGAERSPLGGTFFLPTVLAEVTTEMLVTYEEIFGPLAPLYRFSDEAEAITMANATEFGLAAYFYSRDLARVWRVAEALDVGLVGINTGLLTTEMAPLGGIKESGYGREGLKHGLDDFLTLKYHYLGGIEPAGVCNPPAFNNQ